jgi:D-alanine-D-alanine ligase
LDAESAVAEALEDLHFATEIIEISLDLAAIETLPSRRPLLVFNLVDAIEGDGRLAPRVPARLEALGIPYTGCGTRAVLETLSKVGTKLKLTHAGLPTPDWSVSGKELHSGARVIIKPVWEHGSLGLDQSSVVCCTEASRVIDARTSCLKTEHFVETYIEGREFHVALLERTWGVESLPIAEILFDGLEPKVYGFDGKWTPDSAAYIGTSRRFGVEEVEPELAEKLKQLAGACWTLFEFRGYARVDFRVDTTGTPFVIDVNPNPYLSRDSEDAAAAAEAGLSYKDWVASILESSLKCSQASARGCLAAEDRGARWVDANETAGP